MIWFGYDLLKTVALTTVFVLYCFHSTLKVYTYIYVSKLVCLQTKQDEWKKKSCTVVVVSICKHIRCR